MKPLDRRRYWAGYHAQHHPEQYTSTTHKVELEKLQAVPKLLLVDRFDFTVGSTVSGSNPSSHTFALAQREPPARDGVTSGSTATGQSNSSAAAASIVATASTSSMEISSSEPAEQQPPPAIAQAPLPPPPLAAPQALRQTTLIGQRRPAETTVQQPRKKKKKKTIEETCMDGLPDEPPAGSENLSPGFFYRKTSDGPKFPLPSQSLMLARRLADKGYPCVSQRVMEQGKLRRPRKREHGDCLHGIALNLQQREKGGVKKRRK